MLEAGTEPAGVVTDEHKAEEAGMALRLDAGGQHEAEEAGAATR